MILFSLFGIELTVVIPATLRAKGSGREFCRFCEKLVLDIIQLGGCR